MNFVDFIALMNEAMSSDVKLIPPSSISAVTFFINAPSCNRNGPWTAPLTQRFTIPSMVFLMSGLFNRSNTSIGLSVGTISMLTRRLSPGVSVQLTFESVIC